MLSISFIITTEKTLATLSFYHAMLVYDGNIQRAKGYHLVTFGQHGDTAEKSAIRAGMTMLGVDNQGRVLARLGDAVYLFRNFLHTHAGQVAIVQE